MFFSFHAIPVSLLNNFFQLLPVLHASFDSLHALISPFASPTNLLAKLISSSDTPLYTAIILSSSFPGSASPSLTFPSSLNYTYIPIISFHPVINTSRTHAQGLMRTFKRTSAKPFLSSFKPDSILALLKGLLHDPHTLKKIREECAMGFLRWREIEKAIQSVQPGSSSAAISSPRRSPLHHSIDDDRTVLGTAHHDWESELSIDVARRLGPKSPLSPSISYMHPSPQMNFDEDPFTSFSGHPPSSTCASTSLPFDPLHFPSLVLFSLSLFGPLRSKLARALGLTSSPTPSGLGPSSRANNNESRQRPGLRSTGTITRTYPSSAVAPSSGMGSRRSASRAQAQNTEILRVSRESASSTTSSTSSGPPSPSGSKRRKLGWLSLGIGLGIGLGMGLGIVLSLQWQLGEYSRGMSFYG